MINIEEACSVAILFLTVYSMSRFEAAMVLTLLSLWMLHANRTLLGTC